MSDIDISLKLTDGGSIKAATADSNKLNDSLSLTERLTTKVNAARAAAFRAGSSNAPEGEGMDYGKARAAGGTGAAGRDFAKQAQGLGGLVHVYATFAANLFAVGAAFRALSEAADTTNMVKGLDQLGAASGKSMGTMAKNLVDITDGAVSMREAMEATTKGVAAGLSNKQLMELTEVAKKASQTLGLSMPDALSRLSRGISKIEPELIDELGLYTKLDKATQDYARSIGKTTESLSDYERRQAFALAVIKEGLDKYSAIKLDTNPYDKLSSAVKNLLQNGLSLVNTVLGPLVNLLSSSPTALVGVFTLIGSVLLKQAIPAISAWREGLNAAAVEAAAHAKKIHDSFMEYDISSKMGSAFQKANPFKEAANEAIASAQTVLATVLNPKSAILKKAMTAGMDPTDVAKSLSTEIARSTTQLAKLQSLKATVNVADAAQLKAIDQEIEKQDTRIGQLKLANALMLEGASNTQKYVDVLDKAEKGVGSKPTILSGAWMRQQLDVRAKSKAASAQILSDAADNTQVMGMSEAFKKLNLDIKASTGSLTLMGTAATYVRGTFAILGATISLAFAAIMPYVQLITVGILAFQALDGVLDNTKKEQENFNKAIDAGTDSLKTINDTMAFFSEKSKSIYSVEGINAMSNSLQGLSDTMANQAKSFDDLTNKQGAWARGWDSVKSFVSFRNWGSADKMIETLSQEIPKALDTLVLSSQSAASKAKLAELLLMPEGTNITQDSVAARLKEIKAQDPEGLSAVFLKIASSMKGISDQESKTSADLNSFIDSLKELDKEADIVNNKLQFKDGAGKLGVDLQDSALKLKAALNEPIKGLEALIKLSGDVKVLSFLPENLQQDLMSASVRYKELEKSASEAAKKQIEAKKRYEDLKESGKGGVAAQEVAKAALDAADSALAKQKSDIASFLQSQSNVYVGIYEAGARKINEGLKAAIEQASLTKIKSDLDLATAAGMDTVKQNTALQIKKLDLDKTILEAAYEERKVQIRLAEAMEKAAAETEISNKLTRLTSTAPELANSMTAKQRQDLVDEIGKAQQTVNQIDLQQAIRKDGKGAGMALLRDRGISGEKQGAMMSSADIALRQEETLNKQKQAAVANIDAQIYDVRNKGKLEQINMELKKKQELIALGNLLLANESARESMAEKITGTYSETQLQRKFTLQKDQANLLKQQELNALDAEQSKLDLVVKTEENKTEVERRSLDISNRRAAAMDKYSIAVQSADLTKQLAQLQQAFAIDSARAALQSAKASAQDEIDQATLNTLKERGRISEDEFNARQKLMEVSKAERAFQESTTANELERQRRLSENAAAFTGDEQASIERASEINRQIDQRNQLLGITKDKTLSVLDITTKESERAANFNETFRKGFEGMADALVDFAKTGKLSFKSLIDNMLTDLLRFEYRAMMSSLFRGISNTGGQGGMFDAMGFAMGRATGRYDSISPGGANFVGPMPDTGAPLVLQAMGGAYDSGIKKFAKGGTFTNSMVTSPTLFKFAHGVGMMGEAGPEAIMPLKRDGQGNLGVRTSNQQQPTTHVVVNNYGNDKATTKETTDSKGNRRIEVIIGDMVAQEVSRTGSGTQQAMTSTFGNRPVLARR